LANTESLVTENLANTESRAMENLVSMENQVLQDLGGGGKKLEEGRGAAPSKRPAARWCPKGIIKTQKHRLQKMRQREMAEKKEEEERDYWFNHLWPMTKPEQTWWEKWLAKEEGDSSSDSSGKEASKVTPTRGKTTQDRVTGTRSRVTTTRRWETATRNQVTTTWTRVTATQVRRMTDKERSQSL
jgi:hypothetical protein